MTEDVVDPGSIRTRAEFGAGLSALREAAGLTVRELARQVGRPAGTLGDYLSGRHVPSAGQQGLIVDVLAACGVVDGPAVEAWLSALRRVRASSDRRTTRTAVPYRGLKPFEPEDAALFFGRQEQTAEILAQLRRLRREPGPSRGVLAVVGPSGSGKSSLLRAGVVAAVRDGALDGDDRWTCTIITPGEDPAPAFAEALSQAGQGPHVVVIDQFEETFTLTTDQVARSAFLATLVAPDRDVVVVLGLRADFFAEAAREPLLLTALRHAQVVVGPLTGAQVRDAITGPATRVGVSVEEGLPDVVLADLTPRATAVGVHEPGSLPLLSHALLATWERSNGRRLTIADYRATGGLDAAVQRTAEEVYSSLDGAQQEVAHELFMRLVAPGDDIAPTRRRISRAELGLAVHPDDPPPFEGATPGVQERAQLRREVVTRFADRRLLTLNAATVEVSHEALLTAWPRLRGWLDADRAGLAIHRRITVVANAWNNSGCNPAALFSGVALETAAEWAFVPRNRRRMNGVELAFVDAGLRRRDQLARAERQRARRLVQLLAVVAVLAVVATGLAIWARTAQHNADRDRQAAAASRDDALSREVAFQARQLDAADPALAQQLALAAYRIAPSDASRAALADESASPVITRVLGPLGPTPLAVAPTRRLVAVGHADGTVHLFALRTGRAPSRLATLPAAGGPREVYALAFTPAGTTLVVGGESTRVRVWDVGDPRRPRLRATLDPHFTGAVESVGISADGGTLLVGSEGRTPVERWNVTDPNHPVLLAEPRDVPRAATANAVAFSTDGREFAEATTAGRTLVWPTAGAERTVPRQIVTGQVNVASVAFLDRSRSIVLGCRDGSVGIWSDTPVPRLLHTLTSPTNAIANTIAVRPDGQEIAVGYSDGTLRTWGVEDWAPLDSVKNPGPVTGSAFSTDGRILLTTAADGTLRLERSDGRAIPVDGTVFGMGFASSGRALLVGDNGTPAGVRLWDVADPGSPSPLSPLLSMPSGVGASDGTAAVRSDAALVATGNRDGQVELWDTSDPAHARVAAAPFEAVTRDALVESIAFSPDGRTLAVAADDGNVALWNVEDPGRPRLVNRLHGAGLMLNAAFSPNGRMVAGASADDTVYLWDVTDAGRPRRVARLTGFASYVYGVAFAPDSRSLAATSSDHTTRVWDVSTPSRPIARDGPLIGPTGYVLVAAFSPDGRDLAVGSDDHTVRIYDLRAHDRVPSETLTAFPGSVWSLSFNPAGNTLVAAGRADTVLFWSTDYRAYARRLCPLAGDPITHAEWSLYVPGAPYDPPCR